MAKKLYVGNLPFSTTREELTELFSAHGEVVDVNVIIDKFSGRSKGFAFVEMSTEEEAQKAATALDGSTVGERQIKVTEARPPKQSNFRRN